MLAHRYRFCTLLVAILYCPHLAIKPCWGEKAAKQLEQINGQLQGRLVDYTHNHGRDNRRQSEILQQPRDLYVYLPPGYDQAVSAASDQAVSAASDQAVSAASDQATCYPLILWLHGAFGDEHGIFNTGQLPYLDRQIACGEFPPVIVACPDGTCRGRNSLLADHSLYVNGCGGRYEDHIMQEVLPFLQTRYSVKADRRSHIVLGMSAGGFGAMHLALKHRAFFGAAVSLGGAVNFRYWNRQKSWFADFHPSTYRWRTDYDPHEVVGVFYGGLVKIRAKKFIEPVFGKQPGLLPRIIKANPADLLASTNLQPGELGLFLAYGGRDQINLDAHGASFAWLARKRGVQVEVVCYPEDDHTRPFFNRSQIKAYQWIEKWLQQE